MAAIDGNMRRLLQIPERRPCTNMNCQYFLHDAVIMMAARYRTADGRMTCENELAM